MYDVSFLLNEELYIVSNIIRIHLTGPMCVELVDYMGNKYNYENISGMEWYIGQSKHVAG